MLTEAVASYLALHRAMGFAYKGVGEMLLGFARFASGRGESLVREETALEWAATASTPSGRDRRLRVVARFARHVRAEEPRHEVPPEDRFAQQRRRRVPYIFSAEDITRLVAQAQLLEPKGSLRPLSHSTLLALLASTGLRISEALALRLDDFSPDGLIIRQTKFRKSRLVPLHETAIAALERYRRQRLLCASDDDHLLIGLRGKRLRYRSVHKVFRRLVAALGLQRSEEPSPQIHSFRHNAESRIMPSRPVGTRAAPGTAGIPVRSGSA